MAYYLSNAALYRNYLGDLDADKIYADAYYTHSDSFTRNHSNADIGDTTTYEFFDAHNRYAMRITGWQAASGTRAVGRV